MIRPQLLEGRSSALVASKQALDDAKFEIGDDGDDVGIWIGSALGGLAFAESQHDSFREHGARAVRPLLAISVFGGAATANVALAFGVRGANVANANSCAAGAVAIGEAYRAIARGDVRAALAGGAEAPLSPLIFGAFAVIKAMSTRNDDPARASRPFDRDRDGFVMSEGAGVLFLERYEDAMARGVRVYGEVAGFGLTADAYHMTAPQPEGRGSSRAMQSALREARVGASELELIDAHGSSSPLNDVTETAALKRALGDAAYRVPVTGTKGQHGHALGATGAWEAALSLLAIHEKRVPRTVNLEHLDPACDLDYVREERPLAPRVVLSNSTGFGGINAALVLRGIEY
ncbi:MAG: beta-ketoacyl-ACP synthase II [Candidatus Eremiobacteraeota bacterium]|nr:beta-ketoacyl-ACP synthase II [Candidatus Eremiobacteraeota bacterium]